MGQAAFVGCDYYGTTTDVTDPDRVARMIVQPQYCAFTYVGGGMRDDVPGDTVVAFSRSIDDNGGGSVLFADGHADWVCGPVAQYLIDHARPGGRPVVWSEVRAAIDRAYPGQHLTGDAN